MYVKLLKQLIEEVITTEGNNWHITLYPDGSGELCFPDETPLHLFNNEDELKIYVDAICENATELLTIKKCMEIITEAHEKISEAENG